MSVQKRDLFKTGPNHAASSGDGASSESAYDPSTGQAIPGYKAPQPSPHMDTKGRNGGLGQSAAGAADIAKWHSNQRDFGIGKGLGSYGYGIGEPDPITTTGQLPADSNRVSTTTTGGTDEFVRRSGGGDDAGLTDSNLGAGGKSIA